MYIASMKLVLSISSYGVMTVINESAAATLLEQRPEKKALSGIRVPTLRCWCSALSTELSKPHESGRVRVALYMWTLYLA